MNADRGAQRWEERRRAVRRVSLALGLLLLVAVAFAVWLAVDAPDTRIPTSLDSRGAHLEVVGSGSD